MKAMSLVLLTLVLFLSSCGRAAEVFGVEETPDHICAAAQTFDLVFVDIAQHAWPAGSKPDRQSLPLIKGADFEKEFPLGAPTVEGVAAAAHRITCKATIALTGSLASGLPSSLDVPTEPTSDGLALVVRYQVGKRADTGARVVTVDRSADIAQALLVVYISTHPEVMRRANDEATDPGPTADNAAEEWRETQKYGVGPAEDARADNTPPENSSPVLNASKPGPE